MSSEVLDHAKDAVHSAGEAISEIPSELQAAVDPAKHPRIANIWQRAAPVLKVAAYGAAFVGGGMLLVRWFGGSTARALGRQGGEGFAQGVNAANDALGIQPTHRGSRFDR